MLAWVIMELDDVLGTIRRHRRKVCWGIVCIDGIFGGKEDVEEKIKYSFRRNAAYVADRNTAFLVLHREVRLRRWFIKRKSALLTEHLAAVHLAVRKGVIQGVRR